MIIIIPGELIKCPSGCGNTIELPYGWRNYRGAGQTKCGKCGATLVMQGGTISILRYTGDIKKEDVIMDIPMPKPPDFRRTDCCDTCIHRRKENYYEGDGSCKKYPQKEQRADGTIYDYFFEVFAADICDDFKRDPEKV